MRTTRNKTASVGYLLLLMVVLLLFSQCKIYTAYKDILSLHHEELTSDEKGKPRLEYFNSIPIIHVYGSPYEMGFQYGSLLKSQLNSLSELARDLFSAKRLNEFMSIAKAASTNLPPAMFEEIKGMADASGVDLNDLLAINLVPRTNCSTLAVWGDATTDGHLIMGRNADYSFKNVNKALGILVVKHPEKGLATVTSSFLGMIGGFSGMNEKGVSYGNMLSHNGKEKKYDTRGLSIQILLQLGGQQFSNAREMARFMSGQIQITPNNVMCADNNEALVIECAQTQSAIREGQKGVLSATNHFVTPSLCSKHTNCERFATLMQHARKNYGNYTVEKVQEAMHLARMKRKNLQCVIFEPEYKTIHLSINKVPASKGPFTTIKIEELLNN